MSSINPITNPNPLSSHLTCDIKKSMYSRELISLSVAYRGDPQLFLSYVQYQETADQKQSFSFSKKYITDVRVLRLYKLFGRICPICPKMTGLITNGPKLMKWNSPHDINSVTAIETLRSGGKAHLKAIVHVSPNLLKHAQLLKLHYGRKGG
jgi:hypothetical protein